MAELWRVGKTRVRVVTEDTGEEIGRGVLREVRYEIGDDRRTNESEISVRADLPPSATPPPRDPGKAHT